MFNMHTVELTHKQTHTHTHTHTHSGLCICNGCSLPNVVLNHREFSCKTLHTHTHTHTFFIHIGKRKLKSIFSYLPLNDLFKKKKKSTLQGLLSSGGVCGWMCGCVRVSSVLIPVLNKQLSDFLAVGQPRARSVDWRQISTSLHPLYKRAKRCFYFLNRAECPALSRGRLSTVGGK